MNRLCVVGSGFMGVQIALQAAVAGKSVWLQDREQQALDQGCEQIEHWLQQMLEAEAVNSNQLEAIQQRIQRTTRLVEATSQSQLVIEAVRENLEVKRELFAQLDKLCPPDTILATNSSSLRISRIESATSRPDRVLNAHFVQPIWKHPFVELMRGRQTSDATMESVRGFMEAIGVLPVIVQKESTGFIYNRIWRAVKKEALKVVDSGIATPEDVDRTWMIQMESPMGPMAAMDTIGLDVIHDIELVYYEESGDPSDAPPKVLSEKVARGELGVKTGKGFYEYPDPAWESADFCSVPRVQPDSQT